MPPKGRTSIKGQHKKPKQYKRVPVNNQEKQDVVCFFKEHEMAKTLEHFYSALTGRKRESMRRQILRWVAAEAKIEACAAQAQKIRSVGSATVLPADAEEELVRWIGNLRCEGIIVSPLMLQLKARELAEDNGIPRNKFSASRCWRKGFLARHKLAMRRRTHIGQNTPDDATAVAAKFRDDVQKLIELHSITKVYNADQTAVNYEYVPTQPIDQRVMRTVWVRNSGREKDRATVMLLAYSHGKKMLPFVVFKQPKSTVPETVKLNHRERGFGSFVWKEIQRLEANTIIQIYENERGWFNAQLTLHFLRYHFGGRDSDDDKILLLLDDFSGHWTKEVRAYAEKVNVLLFKVSPRYTAVCQPADIDWMRPLKLRLRECWMESVRHQLNQFKKGDKAAAFKLMPPSGSTLIEWIRSSWSALLADTVASGFRRLGLRADTRAPKTNRKTLLRDVDSIVAQLEQLLVAQDMGSTEIEEE